MNLDLDWYRLPALAGLLIFVLGNTGCVLPGGLMSVGGQQVNGWIWDSTGKGIPDQKLVLVQGPFDRLDSETVQYVAAPADVWKLERVELITDAQGQFSHQLRGFTHCDPLWIIPPLGSLPSKLAGDTEHGKFFILETPGSQGGIYEIRLKGAEVVIRKWSHRHKRKQRIDSEVDLEEITATTRMIEKKHGNDYVRMIPQIEIEVVRRP